MSVTQTTDDRHPLIQSRLPEKISGIVFWGMVLIGLLTAMVLLHGQKREQFSRDTGNALVLTRAIGTVLRNHPIAPLLQINRDRLVHIFEGLHKTLGFEAVTLADPIDAWRFGTIQPPQFIVVHTLLIGTTSPGRSLSHIRVTIYFPDLAHAAAERRNRLMLAMGLTMMLFGLILQQILQRLLSRPFSSIVASAQQFADGDTTARIDEALPDEFGFLAQFVNRALDSLVQQQAELKAALSRAAQSERALSREKERAELTLYSITDGVITGSAEGLVQYVNPVAERLTGWTNDEARNVPLDALIQLAHETTGERFRNPAYTSLQNNAVETVGHNAVLLQPDGGQVAIEMSAAPMHDDRGTVIGVVLVFQDVHHARQLARQLSYQASHDALTGLFNRHKFEQCLNELLESDAKGHQEHALFYLDVDQFKIVNDTCGHVAGDKLLRQISVVLRDGIRREDVLARLGGDEFGILLKECPLTQATEIAEQLRRGIKGLRFTWQDKTFEVGVSIGVVAITADNLDAASILSSADLSCYAAKDMGRNRIHVYQLTDATMAQRHREMDWSNLIVMALENDQFLLYRQTMQGISSACAHLEHHEVLVRMRGHDGRIILPGSFISAAERYNLMPSIDRWVIHNTFSAIADGIFWPRGAGQGRMVAINLSGASLGDGDLLSFIQAARDEFGVSLSEVCFEITETVAISNLMEAKHLIKELRKFGCRFALDDFGNGLSSFGYLKNLPVDYVKIDGGFVKDMVDSPIDRAIVEAITQVGQIMHIQTIAEWVENDATLRALKEIGVDFAQGYRIGKPQAAARHTDSAAAHRFGRGTPIRLR